MMGRQSRQMAMVFVDMASLIPENHLLRKIDGMVSFDFIYGLLAPYYSAVSYTHLDTPQQMFHRHTIVSHMESTLFFISPVIILKTSKAVLVFFSAAADADDLRFPLI